MPFIFQRLFFNSWQPGTKANATIDERNPVRSKGNLVTTDFYGFVHPRWLAEFLPLIASPPGFQSWCCFQSWCLKSPTPGVRFLTFPHEGAIFFRGKLQGLWG